MISHIGRIFRSLFALPVWVIVWMVVFLLPANVSGFFFLDTVTGRWIAIFGGGALAINLVLVLLNGGFSRVLAIPHVIFWGALEIMLLRQVLTVPLEPVEFRLALIVLVINGVSLLFDVVDTRRWYRGERDVAGFEGMPVRI